MRENWTTEKGIRVHNTNFDNELWVINHPDGKFHTIGTSKQVIKRMYPEPEEENE